VIGGNTKDRASSSANARFVRSEHKLIRIRSLAKASHGLSIVEDRLNCDYDGLNLGLDLFKSSVVPALKL